MKIALATGDVKSVNRHFGSAPYFVIAEVSESGFEIVENRENDSAIEQPLKEQNHTRFEATVKLVSDCQAVIAAKIGRAALNELQHAGIQALEQASDIHELLTKYVKYLGKNGFRPLSKQDSTHLGHVR